MKISERIFLDFGDVSLVVSDVQLKGRIKKINKQSGDQIFLKFIS